MLPLFAVEVRSENDYGPAAEREMAAKRADYFAAGTRVVWDVDLLGEDVVRVYRDTRIPTSPPPSIGAARARTPNRPCPAGPCRWTIFSNPDAPALPSLPATRGSTDSPLFPATSAAFSAYLTIPTPRR